MLALIKKRGNNVSKIRIIKDKAIKITVSDY